MVRCVNVIGAITATAGMISMVSAPLLAEGARGSARAPHAATLEWAGSPSRGEFSASEVASMVDTLKGMRISSGRLRELSTRMQPGWAHLDEYVKRQTALADALEKLAKKVSVREELASLGVEIKKSPTRQGATTTFSVRGTVQLRLTDPAPAPAMDDSDQPASGPAVHGDEYDDLEAASVGTRDDALALLAAADLAAEVTYAEIASTDWSGAPCLTPSGPAAEETSSCVDEAFNALLSIIGARGQYASSASAIQAAWADFKALLDQRPAIAVATAAADAFIATVGAEVIITTVVVVAVGYFTYELYDCLRVVHLVAPAPPEIMRPTALIGS